MFENLNTSSVKLGPFEILTAKFFKSGVRLRKLWEEAGTSTGCFATQSDNDHSGFSIDPYLVLQIITLIVHKAHNEGPSLTS